MVKIQRALISLSDKTRIVELAQVLNNFGVRGVSIQSAIFASRINGTQTNPTRVLKGDTVGAFSFLGQYDNTVTHTTTSARIFAFAEDDYTSEEWKMVKETHKIMHDVKIQVTATTVRVPVKTGHSEAIYVETRKPLDISQVKAALAQAPGIVLLDDVKNAVYPMPADAEGCDEVFVSRVRKDPFNEKGIWLWVVADNLRKGAATNAVQIAELLIKK